MHQRILEKATEMFFKSGVRSITMDEISECLGISKRTLYENYSNKEELLKACIEFHHNTYISHFKELFATVENPLEIVHIHIVNTSKALSIIHPNFIKDIKKFHPKIWNEFFIPKRDMNIEFTKDIIKRGIEQGYFRDDINPEIMALVAHNQFHHIDDSPLEQFPRKEVFEHIVMNFIRGMATEKGHKMINQLFDNNKL
jgi:TetR/AcrR family transcriptional regulator, cholesterol catabolism regulator